MQNGKQIILGLNAYHADSSAAIIVDNKLIAAAEEERFNREKHWSGFPIESIKFCLNETNLEFKDITDVAINSNQFSNLSQKILYSLTNLKFENFSKFLTRNKKKFLIRSLIDYHFGKKNNFYFHRIDHHLSHLASAFYPSEFDRSLGLSIDGMGDFCSIAVADCNISNINKINIKKRIFYPNSLGIFYESITQFLGFKNYGDEYKVMGLAPYGKPIYRDILEKLFLSDFELDLKYFNHHRKNYNYKFEGTPVQETILNKKFNEFFNESIFPGEEIKQFHMDIAASTQKIFEEKVLRLINNNININNSKLVIAGGCAMNSSCNGKIIEKKIFDDVFIPSAPGDSGGAIGSALVVLEKKYSISKLVNFKNPYLGKSYNSEQIKRCIIKKINLDKFKVEEFNDEISLITNTIKFILSEKIVGWFQGHMEFGSRALGNRSIICDPRLKHARDLINTKIKFREKFRPFAPSILVEHVSEWFECDNKSDYMSFVYKIKKDRQKTIPAVTHIDGTGRLQTVSKEINSKFYNLILEFYKKTSVPILLNTSFNENEPIVESPYNALETFLKTNMDVLVLENYVISRK